MRPHDKLSIPSEVRIAPGGDRYGTTTEFVRFPDEGHDMSGSGSPKHPVERFEAILDWHDRHLR